MDDEKAIPPLVVSGVSLLLKHRFAIVWRFGRVTSFPDWEKLKEYLRDEVLAGNPEVRPAKVFIYSKQWMEVPNPEA